MAKRGPRLGTLCVHAESSLTGARSAGESIVRPIDRSTTFRLEDEAYRLRRAGRADLSRVYARETNPTVEALEDRLRSLERAHRTLVFSSGMAALHAVVMATLARGDNLVAVRQLYGGSFALFQRLLERIGVELRAVDVDDESGWRSAIDARTRVFACESISNPLTAVIDLEAAARILAQGSGGYGLLVVDATLASPLGQRPLSLGAHIVWHSATKFLGGHSDLIGGVVSGSEAVEEVMQAVWGWRTSAGGCIDPEGAFLLDRGLKTLALRMRAHASNALAVARFLASHPRVTRVNFCGLERDPNHARAQRMLALPGGLLSFAVAGGDDVALGVLRKLRVISEASSLGSVESLATRPRDLSHAYLSDEERLAAGIEPGLLRLAVGIEDEDDLIEDLAQALG